MRLTHDYIIVGQGLAGSCLALQLIRRGKKILVIDEPEKNICSTVAAGLFNPVTGQNLVKTWMADRLFPYLHNFYEKVEEETGIKILHALPMYRPFLTIEEQNEWMARTTMDEYKNIIGQVFTAPAYGDIHNSLGGVLLTNSGFIDTQAFLSASRTIIEAHACLYKDGLQHNELQIHADYVAYHNWTAKKIIFCEGYKVAENPWFNKLPIRPLKGESLRIKTSWTEQVMLNRGVYMVPSNQPDHFKVGSTYQLKNIEYKPTQSGKEELEQKLRALIQFEYSVEAHEWGIRPTTVDRRPILGEHPVYKPLVIFNGLGTKGVSLAPYFSNVLAGWLESDGSSLPEEINVSRFKLLN
jgi:glycine oxidase